MLVLVHDTSGPLRVSMQIDIEKVYLLTRIYDIECIQLYYFIISGDVRTI